MSQRIDEVSLPGRDDVEIRDSNAKHALVQLIPLELAQQVLVGDLQPRRREWRVTADVAHHLRDLMLLELGVDPT